MGKLDDKDPAFFDLIRTTGRKNWQMAVEAINAYGNLLQVLPEQEQRALLNELVGTNGFNDLFENHGSLEIHIAFLGILPDEGIAPAVRDELKRVKEARMFDDFIRMDP